MSLNKVMMIGQVGKDPDVGTANEQKVASFSVCMSEKWRDKSSGEWKEQVEWANVVAWRNLADIVEKFVKKGSQVYVEGKLHNRQWTDRDNNKRVTTEVVADSVQLLGGKATTTGDNNGNRIGSNMDF